MTMNYYSVDGDGLFDIQGFALHAADTLNEARNSTVPDTVEAVLAQLNLVADIPLTYEQAGSPLPNALTNWQNNGTGLCQSLTTFCQSLLQAFVAEDTSAVDKSVKAALTYLIEQMEADGYYVSPNTVGGVLTPDGSNAGDSVVTWSLNRGDGKDQENAIAETITLTVSANPSATAPSIKCVGEASTQALNHDWPAGSGTNRSISATNPAASLLSNGNFDTYPAYTDIPDNWVIGVGVPGTTVKLTTPEVQTVVISGTPTGGTYVLLYTDRAGNVHSTPTIAYNATAGTVQTALRTFSELSGITVSSTGTTPNYTHTITLTGVGGDLTELTSINMLTGGTTPTITHDTTEAGDTSGYRGISLELAGDNSTLQTIYHSLSTLSTETVYFVHLRAIRSGTATGAVVKVSVVQEIDGAVLDDSAGEANELEIDAAALSDSEHESKWFSFRLPKTAVSPVYLRLAVTTAIPTAASIYFDEIAVAAGTVLYKGGPYVAAFSGRTPSQEDDYWTLAISNDRGGSWQEWYNRAFGMASKALLLPTSGDTLIPDDLIDVYPA